MSKSRRKNSTPSFTHETRWRELEWGVGLSSFGLSQRSNGLLTKEEIVQNNVLNVPYVNNWVVPNYSQLLHVLEAI